MAKATFSEELEKPVEGANKKSDWFKVQEGDNRLRILSNASAGAHHYSPSGYKGVCIGKDDNCKGCAEGTAPSIRYLVWVLDRRDNEIKPYNMPYKAYQQLAALQKSADWGFDEVPMPYDINLNAKGAGSKDVVYTLMPTPKREELPEEVKKELEKKTPTDMLLEKMKDKARKEVGGVSTEAPASSGTMKQTNASGLPEGVEYPADDINVDDIPF